MIMAVRVYFRAGGVSDFVVSDDILAADFQHLAESVGGKIHRLVFL
jgi:hypothetical protein